MQIVNKKSYNPLEVVRQRRTLALSGLTLVEVMVAMTIFVMVISGILAVFVATGKFNANSRYRLEAINIARAFLEQTKPAVRQDTWDSGMLALGRDVLPPQFQDIISSDGKFVYNLRYTVEAVPQSVCRKVIVSVSRVAAIP